MEKGTKAAISIIVPAYRAEKFIVESLKKIDRVVSSIDKNYEIICVVDGWVDNTYKLASLLASKNPRLRVFGYRKNHGKGYAVRYGMKQAKGRIVGFLDAGLEIDPRNLKKLVQIFNANKAHVVVGSKRHPESKVEYPFGRKVVSFIYFLWVKLLFNFKVSDTQAGIKLFRSELITKVLPNLEINGYAFDCEVLSLSRKKGFTRIYEAPIVVRRLKYEESTIASRGFVKSSLEMFTDTFRVFYKHKNLKL
jgi:glycosyltransferase involved in cell wall biosynthesis